MSNNRLKLLVGIAISIGFLYLAFSNVNLELMVRSIREANIWLFIPAILIQFIAHWLRAVRWQIFLKSIKKVSVFRLFSATMIGYMGNTVLPAHLGEIFRANVIGNKEGIPTSSVLATLVIERIIDVMSLFVVMLLAIVIYPFPTGVILGGYIMFGMVSALFLFLVLLKKQNPQIARLMKGVLSLLPLKVARKIEELLEAFIAGINGMERKRDYLILFLLSLSIWFFYWLTLHVVFYSFDLMNSYNINEFSSVVMLVTTTFSIVIPSSPGYIGTYHYAAQITLLLFGVPKAVGLSFGFVAHALSTIPTALVGFVFAWKEGLDRLKSKNELSRHGK